MKICGAVLSVLYAGLMLFAVYKGKGKNISDLLIAAGSVIILTHTILNIAWGRNYILILILGMIGISAGALLNGFRQKNVHIQHHIIRLIAEAVITAICWIGG